MLSATTTIADLIPGFEPENELEGRLTTDASILAGLAWGTPRPGHPEGTVAAHVADMLRRIPRDDPHRAELRAVTIVHDAAKAFVRTELAWSPENDHAVLARRLAARHTDDERLLNSIELHDEAYWQWRQAGRDASPQPTLDRATDPTLLARFIELDASTEGKDLTFLWWFRRHTTDLLRHGIDWSAAPLLSGDAAHFLYLKEFAVEPERQDPVALAARRVIAAGSQILRATGQVLASGDRTRVLLLWAFAGDPIGRILREGSVVRRALRRDGDLRAAGEIEARLYRLDAALPLRS
jgi:hypothetical protein